MRITFADRDAYRHRLNQVCALGAQERTAAALREQADRHTMAEITQICLHVLGLPWHRIKSDHPEQGGVTLTLRFGRHAEIVLSAPTIEDLRDQVATIARDTAA